MQYFLIASTSHRETSLQRSRLYSPNGILEFFNYEVQVVPAVVSEQPRIKAQSYRRDLRVGVLEREVLRVP